MTGTFCKASGPYGDPCHGIPVRGSKFCAIHDSDHADVAQEADGRHRKREAALASMYDFQGLASVDGIRRLVEIAVHEALRLDNSRERVRILAYLAQVATNLLEKGETEQRLQALEAALGPRVVKQTRRS